MSTTKQEQAEQLKLQGNGSLKDGKYTEAIVHYTHALSLDPNNHFLYSNRSLAFLKEQQYYLALQDAKQSIKLQPGWAKGYYRKGEVEFQTGHYAIALISYRQALILGPSSTDVQEAINKTKEALLAQRKRAMLEPWLFCGGGAVLGLLIVLADQMLTKTPSIQYKVIQVLMVFLFCGLGYVCLTVYKYMRESQKMSLLSPPIDLLEGQTQGTNNGNSNKAEENKEEQKSTEPRPHRKGGLGAARLRYKKGKS